MPINSKNKGSSYERKIAQEWRDLGFANCETARYASRKTDDMKIDLVETGVFNVQCKAWESAPSYHKTLASMPEDSNYNLIIHKRNRQGEVVVMSKEDFYEILEMLIKNKVL